MSWQSPVWVYRVQYLALPSGCMLHPTRRQFQKTICSAGRNPATVHRLSKKLPHLFSVLHSWHGQAYCCSRRFGFPLCCMIDVLDASTWSEMWLPDNCACSVMLERGREALGCNAAGTGFILKAYAERSPVTFASKLCSFPLTLWPDVHSSCNVKYKHPPHTSYICMAMGFYF